MTPDDIHDAVQRYLACWANRDAVAAAAGHTENSVWETLELGRLKGRAAMEESYRKIFEAFPDLTVEVTQMMTDGFRAVVLAT